MICPVICNGPKDPFYVPCHKLEEQPCDNQICGLQGIGPYMGLLFP